MPINGSYGYHRHRFATAKRKKAIFMGRAIKSVLTIFGLAAVFLPTVSIAAISLSSEGMSMVSGGAGCGLCKLPAGTYCGMNGVPCESADECSQGGQCTSCGLAPPTATLTSTVTIPVSNRPTAAMRENTLGVRGMMRVSAANVS